MHSTVAKMNETHAPRSVGISVVRMVVMLALAFGYVSTMARGPGTAEYGRVLGYDLSWYATNVMFIFAGFFALKTLHRHGSVLQMLKTRMRSNLIPVAIFALIVITVIYPLFGKPAETLGDTITRLGIYAFGLITCIDPGAQLHGLLDDAKYMCSIQGAIWTLRWGAIAYIGTAFAWQCGIFKNSIWTIISSFAAMALYIIALQNHISGWVTLPSNLLVPLRLGSMFLAGAGVFACLSTRAISLRSAPIIGASICLGLAALNYYALPWTPMIEILATTGFAFLAISFAQIIDKSKLKNVPIRDVSIWIFLIHWPAAQFLLLAFPQLQSWSLIALTLPITLILSLLISKAVRSALILHSRRRTAQA